MVAEVDRARWNFALGRAETHAPFLRTLLRIHPDIADAASAGKLADTIGDAVVAATEAPEPARALRQARQRLALALALGDLAGALPFEEVVGHLSDFADAALDRAIAAAIDAHVPGAPAIGFAAIALGKHGSRELNYSSDIDPILIFDPETLPRRAREEPVEAAVRIARRVIELLQTRDADGYVLRVDLRLRPSPEVTPIALPVEAAISHYESSALAWERAAFVRARAAAGDIGLGERFLEAIQPFVWRRSLDFGAIAEIRAISHRIRGHHSSGQALGPGYDLKRGRGGIREVEFFAQIHQLIHGGRDPALRVGATLPAIEALAAAGRIDPEAAAALAPAYRLFRTIEHRLQMVDDQQTHSLPRDADALDNVARLHGLDDGGALVALLAPHVDAVGGLYDGIDAGEARTLPAEMGALAGALAAAGFAEPGSVAQRIAAWRDGSLRSVRTPAAREAFEAVLPALVEAIGAAPDPAFALNKLEDLLGGLPTAINLFRLLEAQPGLRKLLTDILAYAPTLAGALGRRPELLDRLIDATALEPAPEVATIARELAARERDYEALLDRVRRGVGEQRFALGVQIVEGAADPIEVAGGYARVAEAAVEVVAAATVAEFERAHGRVPDAELVILALGRMGGAELTHASDLDLIYLFTGDFAAQSDGRKELGAVHYFNRLAQRVSGGLSAPTAAGPLYEIDTRLRPSGAQGPLVVSLDAFAKYQREEAWTWEHMALTRARVIFGSANARAATQAIIDEVLARPRDRAGLVADAMKMRGEMRQHKPPGGPLDVKLIDGGLIDLEFCVHVSQLANRAGFDPRLGPAIAALDAQRLLPPGLAEAHRLMTRLLVTLRLVAPGMTEPPEASRALVARACGIADWRELLAALETARQRVSAAWAAITTSG